MITHLTIKNFKSIKTLDMECRRVNVFIGEPNTGKSNILEALALVSWCGRPAVPLNVYVRYQQTQNLFYDELLDEPIRIRLAGTPALDLKLGFGNDNFFLQHEPSGPIVASFGYSSSQARPQQEISGAKSIKFYQFHDAGNFKGSDSASLTPPYGENLFSVVYASRQLREMMQEFFRPYGLQIVFKPQEKKFEVQKQTDGVVVSYPYALTADTLRRMIFFMVTIASNKDTTLVFEEPESNVFPYYTKYLGERIAQDDKNQYFIATHNPYLLRAIVEKGKQDDVNMVITRYQDYQTKIKCLESSQLGQLLDADPFFNLKSFWPEEEKSA